MNTEERYKLINARLDRLERLILTPARIGRDKRIKHKKKKIIRRRRLDSL